MLDNFFGEWYTITKLKISNSFELIFHKSRGKEVTGLFVVTGEMKGAGENRIHNGTPARIINTRRRSWDISSRW